MNDTKQQVGHTPGPWWVENRKPDGRDIHSESALVCRLHDDAADAIGPGPLGEADANLIAAAPDLLAACLRVFDMVDAKGYGAPKSDDFIEGYAEGWADAARVVADAIDKAEGRDGGDA